MDTRGFTNIFNFLMAASTRCLMKGLAHSSMGFWSLLSEVSRARLPLL
jgi:hypothetical protein